jgi:ATP-dependent RNA helicase DeaD
METPLNMMTFESLGLSPELNRALADMAFTEPSPIQAQAIPLLLEQKDVIGQAQTGTGKTAAFAIPLIERLDPAQKQIQAVVLCPTRELAIQVSEEFRKLAKYKPGLTVVSIYGGQPIARQLLALRKRPQIIVGTPGRMLDHLRRGSFHLSGVKTVVLDEADEMLDMGFREDLEKIFDFIPSESRHTVLFSATMPKAILALTQKYMRDPQHILVESEIDDTALIREEYVEISRKNKLTTLTNLIDSHELKLALVFCNTKRQVDALSENLRAEGYCADALHGGMSQSKRDRVMGHFRRGTVHILVATNVAARGIDVDNIQAVVNYDLPESTDHYMHRIGRTGRAGKTGIAFTFVSAEQLEQLNANRNAPGDESIFKAPSRAPRSQRPQQQDGARKRFNSNRPSKWGKGKTGGTPRKKAYAG